MARKRLSTAIPRDWTPAAAEIIQEEFDRVYSQLEPLPTGIGTFPTPTPGAILFGDQAGTNQWTLLPFDPTAQRVIGNDGGVPGWVQVDLTLGVTGTLPATHGGTGTNSVAVGDLLYGSAANVWSKLAKSATATRYLSNTGASNIPAWAQVNLANGVTGTLPDGNLSANIPLLNAASNTFTGNLILANNKYLYGTDLSGGGTRALIGEDTSNRVSIDPGGTGAFFGATINTVGTVSAGGHVYALGTGAADDPSFRATSFEMLVGFSAYPNSTSPTHAGIVLDKYAELWAETYPFGGATTGPVGLLIGIGTNAPVIFASNNTPIAKITSAGLLAYTDATFDIGASGATRFRDLFLSRNAVIGGNITGTYGGNLIFSSDGAFDIGASGLNRPRDFFLSRNATISGTLGSMTHLGVNAAAPTNQLMSIGGSYTLPAAFAVFDLATTVTATSGGNAFMQQIAGTIVSAVSGTHALFAAYDVAWTPTDGGATITEAVMLNIRSLVGFAHVTTACGIKVAAPTGAGTNYAIKSSGKINHTSLPTSAAGLATGDLWNNAGVVNIV